MSADPRGAREDRDIFRLAPTLDSELVEMLAERLEFRGTDDGYVQLSQAYFDQLPLDSARQILALGCGTGVEVRALKRKVGTGVEVVGIDHSSLLIEAAERLAQQEGLTGNLHFQVGDAHDLALDDARFDIVLLHTLVSHVEVPLRVLSEARRVAKPDGVIAIFDGDYASLTFAYPDPVQAKAIDESLLKVVVANPRVMRDLPRLLQEAGLELVSAAGVVYANIGSGSFFVNMAEAFGAVLAKSGVLPQAMVEDWQSYQARAVQENTFFGASNYYTYHARRPT